MIHTFHVTVEKKKEIIDVTFGAGRNGYKDKVEGEQEAGNR